MSFEFWKDSTHQTHLKASSRPVPRIRILSTHFRLNLVSFGERLNPRLPNTRLTPALFFFFFWDRFSVTMTILVENSKYSSEILQQRSCTGTAEYLHQLQACLWHQNCTLGNSSYGSDIKGLTVRFLFVRSLQIPQRSPVKVTLLMCLRAIQL